MDAADRSRLTGILIDARDPQRELASDQLAELLYPELRRLAGRLMRRERADHTLQPTALVGEAFLRMVDQTRTGWKDRAHFLGIAARVMRQVLVDHARRHAAAKRGAGIQRVTFDEAAGAGAQVLDLLVVNDALDRLDALDNRGARVVELRVFGGLSVEEIAHVLGVSKRTVDGDWAMARLWLARELGGAAAPS